MWPVWSLRTRCRQVLSLALMSGSVSIMAAVSRGTIRLFDPSWKCFAGGIVLADVWMQKTTFLRVSTTNPAVSKRCYGLFFPLRRFKRGRRSGAACCSCRRLINLRRKLLSAGSSQTAPAGTGTAARPLCDGSRQTDVGASGASYPSMGWMGGGGAGPGGSRGSGCEGDASSLEPFRYSNGHEERRELRRSAGHQD